MLAINFQVYEPLIKALSSFFDDWKYNLMFLIRISLGIILAIFLGSKVILLLFNNYRFMTLMFFIGLIMGGSYNYLKSIKYTFRNGIFLLVIFLIFIILSISNIHYVYTLKNNFYDDIIFFIGGIIEIAASIIPGISATSLLMILGIYQQVLLMIANILNLNYVFKFFNLYLAYGLGMFLSFIINIYLVNFLLNKYYDIFKIVIAGLSLASIGFLLISTFKLSFTAYEFILGIIILISGWLSTYLLDR